MAIAQSQYVDLLVKQLKDFEGSGLDFKSADQNFKDRLITLIKERDYYD